MTVHPVKTMEPAMIWLTNTTVRVLLATQEFIVKQVCITYIIILIHKHIRIKHVVCELCDGVDEKHPYFFNVSVIKLNA